MLEFSVEIIFLLMGAAFIAGFVDSIAGGGGLITLPVLLLSGMPPVAALATNKVQSVFGSCTAALTYAFSGRVSLREQMKPALVSFCAAAIGALLASRLPIEVIRFGLPVLLIGVALFFAFKPGLNDVDKAARISPLMFMAVIVPLIGFYDGVLGPGTGAFFMLAFVSLAGFGVLKATAHTKFLNFASNIGALTVFALVAKPFWSVGIMMGGAQVAGAFLGARLASRVGSKIIKPLLVSVSLALALKLIFDLF